MLNAYLATTNQLLQNPAATSTLYDQTQLTDYINEARVQVAGEARCIKVIGTFSLTPASQGPYAWSSIALPAGVGIAGVLGVRMLRYQLATSNQVPIAAQSWPWFQQYDLNVIATDAAAPREWAQYGEGVNGTLYVWPPPDIAYGMYADTWCYPSALGSDADPEAIPQLWTVPVPYYAAYKALIAAQTGARRQDADQMMQLYELFMKRARGLVTPDVTPWIYPDNYDQMTAAGGGAPQGPAQGPAA